MDNFESKKTEVLNRIEIKSECEKMGVQFVGGPTDKGWIACFNPYKSEKNPSCGVNVGTGSYRGWFCAFNMSDKATWAVSFWDLCRDLHATLSGYEWYEIFKHYAEQTGVAIGGKKSKKLPTKENVEYYQQQITQEVRDHLHNNRGLNDETIKKFEIGWSPKRSRMAYPVYDSDGKLVNIRFHAWKKDQQPKTQNSTGCGAKRLWGVDRLVIDEGNTVCITEGEWDSMLIEQETNLISVSPTNGARAFDMDWVKHFTGKHVVFVWDCDKEGRDAVDKIMIPAFKGAVRRGEVLSLKVVWLFDAVDKALKDFTDFIAKAGGTGKDLMDKIFDAVPLKFEDPNKGLPEPIVLESFEQIDDSKYAGDRVTVPLYVYGENSATYHAYTRVLVGDCPMKKKIGCNGRQDWQWTCDAPIDIKPGSRIQLSCVNSTDHQVRVAFHQYVCDSRQRPNLIFGEEDVVTLREIFAHQVITGAASSEELAERAVYVLGDREVPIGQYQATGFIRTNPKNQQPTMLIDTLEHQEADWQSFDLEEQKSRLKKIQKASVDELLDDISSVTKIYDRNDLHLTVLLTLCSPAWINFSSDGRIRGWISSIIIGDTGTGKTSVSEGIFEHIGVGYGLSGSTSSRTGITYALDHNERTGWKLKAGVLLKMSGQALILDEAQEINEADLKTMTDAMDTGRLKVDRIQAREFKAETRCIFSCNPREKHRKTQQRVMGTFRYGALSIKDLFPRMMIRRVDLFQFLSSSDMDTDTFYKQRRSSKPKYATPENLRALVHYAWNLKDDQIVISDEISESIYKQALKLSNKFGRCADLPIVYPADFRKTFARLCSALAVFDLSTDDDFKSITVKQQHVEYMAKFIDSSYSSDACRLDAYSKMYRDQNEIDDPEALVCELDEELQDKKTGAKGAKFNRFCIIIKEFSTLDPTGKDKISQKYFTDLFDVNRQTLLRDMRWFVDKKLIQSSRGYRPTTLFIQFLNYIDKNHPNFLEPNDAGFKDEESESA